MKKCTAHTHTVLIHIILYTTILSNCFSEVGVIDNSHIINKIFLVSLVQYAII